MRSAACLAPLLAALAPAVPAQASGWNCSDIIEENGLRSGFHQSYLAPFQPPQPIVGPYQIVSSTGFHTGWFLRYKTVDAPFLAPDRIFVTLDTPVALRRGSARFERAGADPVRLAFDGPTQPLPAGAQPRVLFEVKRADEIAALLSARDWNVTLFDAKGRAAGRTSWQFPLDMAGLRSLHARHVANMLSIQTDIAGRCERDLTEEVI